VADYLASDYRALPPVPRSVAIATSIVCQVGWNTGLLSDRRPWLTGQRAPGRFREPVHRSPLTGFARSPPSAICASPQRRGLAPRMAPQPAPLRFSHEAAPLFRHHLNSSSYLGQQSGLPAPYSFTACRK
jgi:hypothetical protein